MPGHNQKKSWEVAYLLHKGLEITQNSSFLTFIWNIKSKIFFCLFYKKIRRIFKKNHHKCPGITILKKSIFWRQTFVLMRFFLAKKFKTFMKNWTTWKKSKISLYMTYIKVWASINIHFCPGITIFPFSIFSVLLTIKCYKTVVEILNN